MLQFNFKKILISRGIDKPYNYLTEAGFSSRLATIITKSEMRTMRLDTLERLCELLNCTPNDLLEWHPAAGDINNEKHALFAIRAKDPEQTVRLTKMLNDIPLDKLKEVEEFIKEQQQREE